MFTRVICVRPTDWHTSRMNGQALHAEKLRHFRIGAKLVAAENTAGGKMQLGRPLTYFGMPLCMPIKLDGRPSCRADIHYRNHECPRCKWALKGSPKPLRPNGSVFLDKMP